MAGRRVEVTQRITPDTPGRVRMEGTSWAAASYTETFEPGELVEVLKQEGLTFYVTRSIIDSESVDGPAADTRHSTTRSEEP